MNNFDNKSNNILGEEKSILNKDELNLNVLTNNSGINNPKSAKKVPFYRRKAFIFSIVGILSAGILATAIAVPLVLQRNSSKTPELTFEEKVNKINSFAIDKKINIWNAYTNTLNIKRINLTNISDDQGAKNIIDFFIKNFDIILSSNINNASFTVTGTPDITNVNATDAIFKYFLPSLMLQDGIHSQNFANNDAITTNANGILYIDYNSTAANASFNLSTNGITPSITLSSNWQWSQKPDFYVGKGFDLSSVKIDFSYLNNSAKMDLNLPYDEAFLATSAKSDTAPLIINGTIAATGSGSTIPLNLRPKGNKLSFDSDLFQTWLQANINNYL